MISSRWGRDHTILPNSPKNCMKLKEFGCPGGRASPRPPRSANDGLFHVIYTSNVCFIILSTDISAGGTYNSIRETHITSQPVKMNNGFFLPDE